MNDSRKTSGCQTALSLKSLDVHVSLNSRPQYGLDSPCGRIPHQSPLASISTLGSGQSGFSGNQHRHGGVLFCTPPKRRTIALAFFQTPHLGAQSEGDGIPGQNSRLVPTPARAHEQILLALLIHCCPPPKFSLQISGPKSTTRVIHNWFFLTQDIGQDLVHSAKFLLGKHTRFFSFTLLNLVLKRGCADRDCIPQRGKKQGVLGSSRVLESPRVGSPGLAVLSQWLL